MIIKIPSAVIKKYGNSHYIHIPSDYVKHNGLKHNQEVKEATITP